MKFITAILFSLATFVAQAQTVINLAPDTPFVCGSQPICTNITNDSSLQVGIYPTYSPVPFSIAGINGVPGYMPFSGVSGVGYTLAITSPSWRTAVYTFNFIQMTSPSGNMVTGNLVAVRTNLCPLRFKTCGQAKWEIIDGTLTVY